MLRCDICATVRDNQLDDFGYCDACRALVNAIGNWLDELTDPKARLASLKIAAHAENLRRRFRRQRLAAAH